VVDITHYFGGDLSWGPTGDLAISSTPDVTTQRVLRRLLTPPLSYLWNLSYGAGLPAMVGQTASASAIRGTTLDQMLEEDGVMQDPPPTVRVMVTDTGYVFADVAYGDAETGAIQPLTVPIAQT
jgi:hypothetical protein